MDFPFPEGLGPDMIYHKTKLFLQSLGRFDDMSIIAYVDKEQFGSKLVGAYKDAGITIIPREGYLSEKFDGALERNRKRIAFLQSMSSLCLHIFLTLLDHDLPPSLDSPLERICFSLPLEPTLLGSSDRKPKSREESLYSSHETIPASPVQSTSYECSTHVFWDGVDFPLPYNDPHYAFRVSQSTLKELDLPAASSLVAYINESDLCGETETDGITIIPCQGDEEARCHATLVDIVLWAMENPATYFEKKSLMVISKNIKQGTDFFNALKALHERHYNVILGEPNPQDLSSPMYTRLFTCAPNLFVREEVVGFSNGLASLYHPEFRWCDVLIFWDSTVSQPIFRVWSGFFKTRAITAT
ncbi:unnamed protein product [Microthlaspi erraticum]|uniref:NYN domain-containing protein n=1 Tax=Microthlaspi erraticum TaxID=1685480 RepID=A0A6D2KSM9_9BRAS|nr:unnamed protein product [Microthlaspi erraticum]